MKNDDKEPSDKNDDKMPDEKWIKFLLFTMMSWQTASQLNHDNNSLSDKIIGSFAAFSPIVLFIYMVCMEYLDKKRVNLEKYSDKKRVKLEKNEEAPHEER